MEGGRTPALEEPSHPLGEVDQAGRSKGTGIAAE